MNVRTFEICRRKRSKILAKLLSWHKGKCWGNLLPLDAAMTQRTSVYLPIAGEMVRVQDKAVIRLT